MKKTLLLTLGAIVLTFFVAVGVAYGQTATASPAPSETVSPTTAPAPGTDTSVPSQAPSTGLGGVQ